MTFRLGWYILPIWLLILFCLQAGADDEVSFNRDIRPLLSDRCFQCHGPDEESRQAELRLDVATGEEGPFSDRGGYQVIQPKDLEASDLWYRLSEADESERMPPVDSKQQPLTDEEQELVKRWFLQGADYDDFWAFEPIPPLDTFPMKNGIRDHVAACLEIYRDLCRDPHRIVP